MSIEVNDESGEAVDGERIAALARFVLDRLRVHPLAELSVLAVDVADDDRRCTSSGWTRRARPTSWPSRWTSCAPARTTRSPSPACSATSCSARGRRHSRQRPPGTPTDEELDLLSTHGILHLLGYDHAEPDEEREMFGLQAELLRGWAESRPGTRG